MLNQYQNTQAAEKWPFDVSIVNEDPQYDFSKELSYLNDKVNMGEKYQHQIYENGTDDVAELKGKVPDNLNEQLIKAAGGEIPDGWATGNGTIYVDISRVYVSANAAREMKFLLSTLTFPLFYMGLVFLAVALTVLSIQQLSDSGKYRFRYQILKDLGMRKSEVNRVVLKQLAIYYLCPFAAALLLSVGVTAYIGYNFTYYSGVAGHFLSYIGKSVLLFGTTYLLYFVVTYEEFKRNVAADIR